MLRPLGQTSSGGGRFAPALRRMSSSGRHLRSQVGPCAHCSNGHDGSSSPRRSDDVASIRGPPFCSLPSAVCSVRSSFPLWWRRRRRSRAGRERSWAILCCCCFCSSSSRTAGQQQQWRWGREQWQRGEARVPPSSPRLILRLPHEPWRSSPQPWRPWRQRGASPLRSRASSAHG